MFHRKTDTKSKPQDLKPDFIAKVLTLFSNRNQKGATLPIAIALGVVMIGIAGIAIMNSGRNKTNVVADEQAKQAIAAAEAGVARIQALLIANPKLAIIDDGDWEGIANGQTPDLDATANNILEYNIVLSDIPTWSINSVNGDIFAQLPQNILLAKGGKWATPDPVVPDPVVPDPVVPDPVVPDPVDGANSGGSGTCEVFVEESESPSQNTATIEFKEDDVTQIQEALEDSGIVEKSGQKFQLSPQKVGGNSGAKFQLVSYNFDGDPNTGGTGTLTVDGEYGSSKARIEIKLPVTVAMNKSSSGGGVPLPDDFPDAAGFWFQDFHVNGGGNQTINFDILDSSGCTTPKGDPWVKPPSGAFKHNGDHVIYNRQFPPLPLPLNETNKFDIPTGLSTINSGSCSLTPSSSASYEYTGGCNPINVDISGGKTVKIYSNVAVPTVTVTGLNNNPGRVVVYGNNGLAFGSSAPLSNANQWKHIQYYVSQGNATTNGNLTSSGFIFAPNSSFHINGGGNGTHTGPIWAKSYHTNGGGSSTLNPSYSHANFEYTEVFAQDDDSDEIITIGSPQGYKRVPVQ